MFVNRQRELDRLTAWWGAGQDRLGLVWGRRRVGKTALLQHFSRDLRTIFHTGAGRAVDQELRLLSRTITKVSNAARDLERTPLRDYDDALEVLSGLWNDRPTLVVLDEFPELVSAAPELPGVIRAFLDRADDRIKLLLCGSAVRTMRSLQDERAPLYGRVDLALQVHPFRPHEAAMLLPDVPAAERARIYAITGGTPLYLRWWDQGASTEDNLGRLVTQPDGRLFLEGQHVLATEAETGDLPGQTLRAIATGRTKHNEIADEVRAEPARTLERLIELRLVERLVPVTDDARRTRRRLYRIADNFLAFWLGLVDAYRGDIERGLGSQVLPMLSARLDGHCGPAWEEAVREHLRRMAAEGRLGGVVRIGRWWRDSPRSVEIDLLGLTPRASTLMPSLVGEVKWARTVDGPPLLRTLARSAAHVTDNPDDLRVVLAAREAVRDPGDAMVITAEDVFGPD